MGPSDEEKDGYRYLMEMLDYLRTYAETAKDSNEDMLRKSGLPWKEMN